MAKTLDILKELIKFNTVNPPADTRGISRYIGKLFKSEGIKYKLLKKKGNSTYKNAVYLFSEIGSGGRCVALYGHSDVVPVGDISLWKTDPFVPVQKNGKVYGRGATDMKGGLAAIISAYIELSKDEEKLNGRVQLVICPDEEDFLVKEKLLPELIKKHMPDACIIAEPHSQITIGEKGEFWLRFGARGKAAHGSTPSAGIDAGTILDDAIHELKRTVDRLNAEYEKKDIKIRKLLLDSDKILAEEFGMSGSDSGRFIRERPTSHITMNVGYIRVGHNINIVPDSAEAHISFVMPYGFDSDLLKKNIANMIAVSDGRLFWTRMHGYNASLTDPHSDIVTALSKAYKVVNGKGSKLVFDTGATDALFYRLENVPTVIYGPGTLSSLHNSNEYIEIADLEPAKRVFIMAVKNFIGLKC